MKKGRKEKILEIINNFEISTQSELAERLQEEGFEVTQATVSRDIKEMQLVKVSKNGTKSCYAVAPKLPHPINERYQRILKQTVQSINAAENIIVVKTLSGCANAAAEAIDSNSEPAILGSIAGDDTILLVIDSKEHVEGILEAMKKVVF